MKSNRLIPVAFVLLFVGAIFTILVPKEATATTWSTGYTTSGCQSSTCFGGQKVEAIGGSLGADFYGLHPLSTTGPGSISCTVSTTTCNTFAAASTFSAANVVNFGFTRNRGQAAICTSITTGSVEFAKNTGAWGTAQVVDSSTVTTGSTPGCGVDGASASDWVVAYSDAGGHALTVRHSLNSGITWTNPITGGGPIETNDIAQEAVVTVVSSSTWIVTYIVGTTPGVGSVGDLRSCKTIDTGATWTCQRIAASPNQYIHIYRTASGRIIGSDSRSSAMTFIFSDDNGDSWSTVSVGSESGAVASIYQFDDNKIMMVWCAGVVSNPGGDNYLHDAVSAAGGRTAGDWTVGSYLLTSANNFGCSATGLGLTSTGTAIAYLNTAFTGAPSCSGCQSFRFIDEQAFGGTAALGAVATRGVTNLVAFDADPYNQVVMSRSAASGTSVINSYDSNSATLATRATGITSTCNQQDGIMAYSPTSNGKQFASWVDCDSSHIIVNNFHIRSGTLSSPDQSGTACSGNTICDIDMSGADASPTTGCSDGYQLPDGQLQLGNIQAIPVDWTTGGQTGINHVEVGFAFSDASNGNIGTWTIRQQTGPDDSCRVEVPFSSPSQTIEICSWRNQVDNNDYIAAIGATSPTSAWQYHLTPFSTFSNLDTSLTAIPASLPAPYNHLIGIACVDNDALVMDTAGNYARVHIIGSNVGGVVWGPIALGGSATNRATAISRDGKAGLVASTTNVKVINALTGATTCTITMPSGNFKEVRISYSAQVAWIATDSVIAKYDIHTCTTGSPTVDGCVIVSGVQTCYDAQGNVVSTGGGSTTSGTSTGTGTGTGGINLALNTADNILGINIGATAVGLNISRTSVLILIAIVLMGVFAIWLYRNTESILGLVVGAFFGLVLAVAMSLLPEWVIIAVVLLLLIIFGKMIFGGFYPGGEE